MPTASPDQMARTTDDAHADLDRCRRLWPIVAEQRLSGPPHAVFFSRPLPTSAAAVDDEMEKTRPPAYGDACGEGDVFPRLVRYEDGQPAKGWRSEADDRRAQLELLDALAHLRRATSAFVAAVGQIQEAKASIETATGSQVERTPQPPDPFSPET